MFFATVHVKFSLLGEHRSKYSLLDTPKHLCSCENNIEMTSHFPLRCLSFTLEKHSSLHKIHILYHSILLKCVNYITEA